MGIESLGRALLGSLRSVAESLTSKPVAPPPPPAAPKPAVFSDGMDGRGTGGPAINLTGTGNAASPEAAVAARIDRDLPMRLYGSTQTERIANLPRLTQIDGNSQTGIDAQTCGIQAIVAGTYLRNPSGLAGLAGHELKASDSKLDGWARNMGMTSAQLRKDLKAIKDGDASPRQISVLSQTLMLDVRTRTGAPGPGLSGRELQGLTMGIYKDAGVEAPEMRLNLRDVGNNKKHWVAQFDVASMADVQEGAQKDHVLTFDPWPNRLGGAQTGVSLNKTGAGTLHQGTQANDGNGNPERYTIDPRNGSIDQEKQLPIPAQLLR